MRDFNRMHFVYRTFDIHGRLLYVGCTSDLSERRRAHRRLSDWWEFAVRFRVSGPYPKRVALDLERAAIRAEWPAFNRQTHGLRSLWENSPRVRMENYLAARPYQSDVAS